MKSDEELCMAECDRIAELLDKHGIPFDDAGKVFSLSDRVEEVLARLKKVTEDVKRSHQEKSKKKKPLRR